MSCKNVNIFLYRVFLTQSKLFDACHSGQGNNFSPKQLQGFFLPGRTLCMQGAAACGPRQLFARVQRAKPFKAKTRGQFLAVFDLIHRAAGRSTCCLRDSECVQVIIKKKCPNKVVLEIVGGIRLNEVAK